MSREREGSSLRKLVDRLIRRYNHAAYAITVLCLYLVGCVGLGVALAPAVWLVARGAPRVLALDGLHKWPLLGFLGAVAFFVFGMSLLVVVPILNRLLPTRIERFKGGYYTFAALPWYVHNALFYMVRFTFLSFVTFTPFGIWFLRAMGMRIGRRPFINTENISDPQLITLGDDVALGGSVTIFAHYGGGGNLVIEPVEIGDGATIGLGATVMGDVKVGPRATVLAHSVLLPGSRVGEGETWGGVPARPIPRDTMDRIKEEIRGIAPPESPTAETPLG
jgi:acetyltransferase-like isoleucine patch superfamily enzyme